MCDCDIPALSFRYQRKARKAHKCAECRETISPGMTYEFFEVLYDGAWGKTKTCNNCTALGDRYYEETKCCYTVGELYEYLQCDHIFFNEDTQLWESREDWLIITSQKPLRCEVVAIAMV